MEWRGQGKRGWEGEGEGEWDPCPSSSKTGEGNWGWWSQAHLEAAQAREACVAARLALSHPTLPHPLTRGVDRGVLLSSRTIARGGKYPATTNVCSF